MKGMNVTFEEPALSVVSDYRAHGRGLTGFLLRHRVVKTLSQARVVLLTLSIVMLVAAGFFGRVGMKGGEVDTRKHFVPAIPTR
jgi:hypothetical protein